MQWDIENPDIWLSIDGWQFCYIIDNLLTLSEGCRGNAKPPTHHVQCLVKLAAYTFIYDLNDLEKVLEKC